MLYNISFDIAAIILTLGLLLVYWLRRNYPTRQTKVFFAMALANVLGSVFDICSAVGISNSQAVPPLLNCFLTVGYHLCNSVVALTFLLYIASVTGSIPKSTSLRRGAIALFDIVVALIVTTPATHLLFYFSPDGIYRHGPLFEILYALDFAIIILAIACLIASRGRLNAFQIVPPIVACMVVFAASAINAFFPQLLLQCFSVSLVLTLVYEVAEANSKFMFSGSYCYNYRAFRDYMNRRIKRSDSFAVVGMGLRDISYLDGVMDYNVCQALFISIGDVLRRRFGQQSTFCLRNGYFVIVCSIAKENNAVLEAIEALKEVEQPSGCSIELNPCFAIMRHPGVVQSGKEADDMMVSALDGCIANATTLVSTVDGSYLARRRRQSEVTLALREAIANKAFEMRYQPIRSVETGKFDSAEALIRLTDPALGFVSPDEFIPLAEANGMILEIGEQIMDMVCGFWSASNLADLGVATMDINLSAVQCAKPGMADSLLYTLKRHGVPASAVCMEVTETAVLNDKAATGANLAKLHEAGVRLALDDYGTGYCSATNLFELPVDVVKIDKSVLWSAMDNDNAMAVLSNVASMSHSLDKLIVAEGVETQEMVNVLEYLGVEHLQGYYYSKPLAESEYLDFLREHQDDEGGNWCQSRFRKLSADLSLEALDEARATR